MNSLTVARFLLLFAVASGPLAGCAAPTSADAAEGSDEAEIKKTTSFTGQFVKMMAIGGETTGTWLAADEGKLVELDLSTHHFQDKFVEGMRVKVTGKFKTINGVEIKNRHVLVVTSLVAVGPGRVTTPGASVVTADATKVVVANHGGGFAPQPPAGSQCGIGEAEFSVDFSKSTLAWSRCVPQNPGAPLLLRSGSRSLSASALRDLRTKLNGVKVTTTPDTCGADKPFETVTVTGSGGSFEYLDAFYSCGDRSRPYADGIDVAMGALRNLAN